MSGRASEKADAVKQLSRRDFARGAALAATAAVLLPQEVLAQSSVTPADVTEAAPKLSPEAQAEAEEKAASILRRYGSRLSEEQRAEVRKNVLQGQRSLEQLRAFPLDNSDEPATILHLVAAKES